MNEFDKKNLQAADDKDPRFQIIRDRAYVILYFVVLALSLFGWIFAEWIETYLITLGFGFLEDWVWGISFGINIITFMQTPKILKILNGGKELDLRNQLKVQRIIARLVAVFAVVFVVGAVVFIVLS